MLFGRSNARLHHTGNSLQRETLGSSATLLCHLSYSSLRHWPDANPQPLYEVARAFTTPQILAAGISGPGICPLLYH
jgi:hypothetical protein